MVTLTISREVRADEVELSPQMLWTHKISFDSQKRFGL